jgi:hypothetical protein
LRFSLVVGRAPFSDPMYAEAVSRTFVAAVANTTRTTDLRELAFIAAFAAAAQAPAAGGGGQLLLPVAGHAPLPLAKLILWRLVAEGIDDRPAGRDIMASTVESFPELAAFVDLLRVPAQGGPSRTTQLAEEIAGAFVALGGSPHQGGTS